MNMPLLSYVDIQYLKDTLSPSIEDDFFVFLRELTVKDVKVYAIDEGSVTFPRLALIKCIHCAIIIFKILFCVIEFLLCELKGL